MARSPFEETSMLIGVHHRVNIRTYQRRVISCGAGKRDVHDSRQLFRERAFTRLHFNQPADVQWFLA